MPTYVPFRLRCLNRLSEILKRIDGTDGYATDINGAVFRGRARFGDNDPLPMLSIIEDPRDVEAALGPDGATTSTGEWRLIVQGFIEDDSENPTDPAYPLAADVKRALVIARREGKAGRNLLEQGAKAPMVEDMLVGNAFVRPPDEISDKAYFWLPLTLKLIEDHEHPFT